MKPKLPKDMTPSPTPWRFEIAPSGKAGIVKGADNSIVCVCHPANAQEIVKAVNA